MIEELGAPGGGRQIHAFPAVTNGPSNKLCEKNSFTNLGERAFEFAGRTLRCNHWRIDLF